MSDKSKKEKIIAAALELFSDKSYHKTTVSEIAGEAGVAKGTVYWYFDSKKQLFQAILLSGIEELHTRIRNKVKQKENEIEKLEIVVKQFLSFFEEGRRLSKMYQESTIAISKDFKEKINILREEEVDLVTGIIEAGKQKGKFKKEVDSQDAASILIGMISAYNPHICQNLEEPVTSKAKVIIDLFLQGIST